MSKRGHYTPHPCIRIDSFDRPHLNVLESFFCEKELPKWKSDGIRVEGLDEDAKFSSDPSESIVSVPGEYQPRKKTPHRTEEWQYNREMGRSMEADKKARQAKTFFVKLKEKLFGAGVEVDKIFAEIKTIVRDRTKYKQGMVDDF